MKVNVSGSLSVCIAILLTALTVARVYGASSDSEIPPKRVRIASPADHAVLPFEKFTVTIESSWDVPAWVELYVNGEKYDASEREGPPVALAKRYGTELTRVDIAVSTSRLRVGENVIEAISYYRILGDPTRGDVPENPTHYDPTKPEDARIHVTVVPKLEMVRAVGRRIQGNSTDNGSSATAALAGPGGVYETLWSPSASPPPDKDIHWYVDDTPSGNGRQTTVKTLPRKLCSIRARYGSQEKIMWVAPCWVDPSSQTWWWNLSANKAPANYPQMITMEFKSIVPLKGTFSWSVLNGADKFWLLASTGNPSDKASDTKPTIRAGSYRESKSINDIRCRVLYISSSGQRVTFTMVTSIDTGEIAKIDEKLRRQDPGYLNKVTYWRTANSSLRRHSPNSH